MPGTYRLDANVTTPGGDCFDITASGVTLHLNGHTIQGGPDSAEGITVFGANVDIVGPGTVTGWATTESSSTTTVR